MYEKKAIISNDKDWVMIWLYVIIAVIGLICIFSVEFKADDNFLKSMIAFKKNYSKQFFYLIAIILIKTK